MQLGARSAFHKNKYSGFAMWNKKFGLTQVTRNNKKKNDPSLNLLQLLSDCQSLYSSQSYKKLILWGMLDKLFNIRLLLKNFIQDPHCFEHDYTISSPMSLWLR